MGSWIANWNERHRHPVSRGLHFVGIPMLPLAGVLVVVQLVEARWDLWWRPVVLVLFSYLLQWTGHRIEGNELGEVVLLKRLLGRPYASVAPREKPGATKR
ncbi:MAG: DUF962 domain-containing protein [bacterium]|nr:DUF962 domain-containing protein [bacterium]